LLRKVFEFPANGDTGAVDIPREGRTQ